jgi:hypothetical protein
MAKFGETPSAELLAGKAFGDYLTTEELPAGGEDKKARGYVASITLTTVQNSVLGNPQATIPGLVIPIAQFSIDRVYEVLLTGRFNTGSGNTFDLFVFDGTASRQIGRIKSPVHTDFVNGRALYIPSATGTKTLQIQALRTGGTGSIYVNPYTEAATEVVVHDLGALL